jgi:cellobiose-specific phosphotransferase system component IIB
MSEIVLVAVIGAVGTVLAALVQAMRKENRDDHAIVADSLNRIENKLDNHIDDHLRGDI